VATPVSATSELQASCTGFSDNTKFALILIALIKKLINLKNKLQLVFFNFNIFFIKKFKNFTPLSLIL
jgi:hypothetical protein